MGEMEEAHKKTLERFWNEVWDQGDLDVVDEIFHPDFVDHGLAPGLTKQGPEGAKEAVIQFRSAIPDLYLKCTMMIAEGDKVLSLWEAGGKQTGPLNSARGTIPPTNKTATVHGMTLNQLKDGKIWAAWDNFDMLGMMQQLGLIPSGPPPGSGDGPPGGGPPAEARTEA
jgi:predicted ester cyclase